MKTGAVEYAWSFMLDIETGKNRDDQRRAAIRTWKNGALEIIMPTTAIRERARSFMSLGVFVKCESGFSHAGARAVFIF